MTDVNPQRNQSLRCSSSKDVTTLPQYSKSGILDGINVCVWTTKKAIFIFIGSEKNRKQRTDQMQGTHLQPYSNSMSVVAHFSAFPQL